jgi:hypothetical protein
MVRATTLVARCKKNKFNISEEGRIQEFNPVKPTITFGPSSRAV